ncbi:MAG: hypothetical protein H6555_08770 [Lewinellaceae bacterium]|nr:hypothetical protein [Lewinellaceae bacterium]
MIYTLRPWLIYFRHSLREDRLLELFRQAAPLLSGDTGVWAFEPTHEKKLPDRNGEPGLAKAASWSAPGAYLEWRVESATGIHQEKYGYDMQGMLALESGIRLEISDSAWTPYPKELIFRLHRAEVGYFTLLYNWLRRQFLPEEDMTFSLHAATTNIQAAVENDEQELARQWMDRVRKNYPNATHTPTEAMWWSRLEELASLLE